MSNNDLTTYTAISTGINGVFGYRCGRIVFLRFYDFNYYNSEAGTLPDKLKPAYTVHCSLIRSGDSSPEDFKSAMLAILATGLMATRSNITSGYLYGSISYIANNY